MHDYADHLFGGVQGVTRVVYEGDSFVGGFAAQKLRETNVVAPWGSTDYQSSTFPPMLTRYADGVVYAWNAWPDEYDTLMWFSAEPGQFWSAPSTGNDPYTRLTVLDTTTVVIDGVPLRQLLIERSLWEWAPPDTLRERIGFSFNYLNGWSWFLTDMPWAGLRCYRDADISFARYNVTDCGYTLNMDEHADHPVAVAYPNPGSAHFTLSLPPGPQIITIVDATGRCVVQQRSSGGTTSVDARTLTSGSYTVLVTDAQGRTQRLKWMKE